MTEKELINYPMPDGFDGTPIRQVYRYEALGTSATGEWPGTKVQVFKRDELIYEYTRNYSFLRTFEPFRQLQGDRWHDYALISPQYSTFQVLDLESREIVAERPYPQRPWYKSETYDEYEEALKKRPTWFEEGGWYAGKGPNDTVNGEGFCPAEFYVPDFATDIEIKSAEDWEKYSYLNEEEGKFGQYALVAGCYWGDDSSWKIQYIDLSRISEGIVTQDERFGYVQLPNGRHLSDLMDSDSYWNGTLELPVAVRFNLNTGKADPWTHSSINWAKTKEEYWGKE